MSNMQRATESWLEDAARFICATCKSIPFDKLPSEEEAAYPHHASFADLEASARACRLCQLLQDCLKDLQRQLDNENNEGVSMADFALSLAEQENNYQRPIM